MISPVKVITPVPETVRSLISVATAPILVVEVPASRITSVAEPAAVPVIAPTDIAPLVVSIFKSASFPNLKPPVANDIDEVEVAFLKVVSPAPIWKPSVVSPLVMVVSPPNI